MVVKFYFGLAKSNIFTAKMVSEHLSDEIAAYHWLFEAGDVETVIEDVGIGRAVRVGRSFSWSPLDYYIMGHRWLTTSSNGSSH